jgi:hypothetical protein
MSKDGNINNVHSDLPGLCSVHYAQVFFVQETFLMAAEKGSKGYRVHHIIL